MPSQFKRLLLGDPLANEEAQHQRLNNFIALPVFASDALSSVAYATEEILLVLVLAGTAALTLSLPIALAIAALIVIVVLSYRQTIRAYPSGGGSYIVAKENLGPMAGLIAGASLLVDYILTVAVSISAGTAAVTSAFPQLLKYTVPIAVVLVVLLAFANLRGVRESGAVFAGPTYFFVAMLGLLIVVGLFKLFTGGTITVPQEGVGSVQTLTLFLILRAFSSGCTAMTGIEAVANGVQAFKKPESHNANLTLTAMAGILLFLFLGTSYLTWAIHLVPVEGQTVVSTLAASVFGRGVLYYMLQLATALILVLAANTSYADFPRLGSFMAQDGYLPRQLKDRGSRLVYSNGMILLTLVALVLIVVFQGVTSALIPLYAVGVFLSFTLSQSGMVIHWWRLRETDPSWRHSLPLNAAGAVATAVVTVVIGVSKFALGAWIVVLLIPILVLYFRWVKSRYDRADCLLALPEGSRPLDGLPNDGILNNHVVLLVSRVDKRMTRAVRYARALRADSAEALFVDVTGDRADEVRRQWEEHGFGMKLTILPSPYRELIRPIREYIAKLTEHDKTDCVTVIMPEFIPENPVDYVLHDQTPLQIKTQLFPIPRVIVVDVPYHLGADAATEAAASATCEKKSPPAS